MRAGDIALLSGAALAILGSLYAVSLIWTGSGSEPAPATVGVTSIGGPFEMVDNEGRRVTEADFIGRPSAIFFGFTYCPDVCPTTLFELTALMEALGPEAEGISFVFVTVDPERDTPEILNEYLTAFDERLIGLTGTPDEVKRMAEAYGVRFQRVETPSGYTMDHTASVFLMNERNDLVSTIDYHEDHETALAKLRRLIDAS